MNQNIVRLCVSLIVMLLAIACSSEQKTEQKQSTETTQVEMKKSVLSPALKRAMASSKDNMSIEDRFSLILLVSNEAGEDQKKQLTDMGIEVSQQVSNKWFIKSGMDTIGALENFEWIKMIDISQTRSMKN